MEDVRELLQSGDSFAALAQKYSESPLAKEGGDLGLIDFKNFSPQIQKALQGLQIGQATAILDTEQGYQIFFVEDIVQEEKRTLDEVYAEIETALYNELVEKEILAWLDDLRKTAHIKIIQ
jgi:peptidyl-prolyl cis-trans isomerase SurA